MRFLKKLGIGDFEEHFIEDLLKPQEVEYLNYLTKLETPKQANTDEITPGDDLEKQ